MLDKSFFKSLLSNQIIVALLVLAVAWLLLEISGVIIAGFIAYIIMAASAPAVDFLQRYKLPRALAAALVYLTVLAILILLIFPLVPFFATQINALFKGFPAYVHNAAGLIGVNFNASGLQQLFGSEFAGLSRNAIEFTTKIFGGFFTLLTIVVLSFYLLLDHERVKQSFASLFTPKLRPKAYHVIDKVEFKLGAWLRGQIALSFFVGFLTWLGLSLVGVEYALPLALLAGMLEIVPTIGPILAAVPGIIVALSISQTTALLVAGVYIVIQLLENNLLVPRIMQKAVGLNPIVVILGIIIGGKLLGILGALLAVPFISLAVVITSEVANKE